MSAPVDLEQFREAAAFLKERAWKLPLNDKSREKLIADADRLLSIIDNVGRVTEQCYPVLPSISDRLAIRMLVTAGYVTEEKANEALRIAHGFERGPLPPPQAVEMLDDETVERAWVAGAREYARLTHGVWDEPDGNDLAAMRAALAVAGAAGSRCTCPSGDGSLRWPCPSHPPAANQAACTPCPYADRCDCIGGCKHGLVGKGATVDKPISANTGAGT